MKLESKANKEVQAKKYDKKDVATVITPTKVEEVGSSAGMRKQQPEKLPKHNAHRMSAK